MAEIWSRRLNVEKQVVLITSDHPQTFPSSQAKFAANAAVLLNEFLLSSE